MSTLLGLGMTLVVAATAQAQMDVSAHMQVNLGSTTHWTTVRGTHVKELRASERPGYDMFRYGGKYYAYNNSQWYSSTRGNGDFSAIDERTVPNELSKVPQNHWHSYPANWTGKGNTPTSGRQRRG